MVIKDVFISYKAEELNEARWVRNALESCGISCWMAPDSIIGGTSYAQEIPAAIRGCKVFVLILSERAQTSKWVPRELDQAINEGKIIMPFMLENCPLRDDFSFYLTNVQRYAAFEDKMAAMEKMVVEIRGILGKGAVPRWEENTPHREPQRPREPVRPQAPPRPRGNTWTQSPAGRVRPRRQKKKKDTACIISLALGIGSFLMTEAGPAFCAVLGFAAMLLAVVGLERLCRCGGARGGKGLASAGFICGALMALIGLAAAGSGAGAWVAILVTAVLAVPMVKKLRRLKGR